MKKITLVVVLAILVAGFAGIASAAGGSCDDAISALPGITAGDMAGAASQWFRFTATRSGDIPVNTSLPGTTFETAVAVYASCGGAPVASDQSLVAGRKAHVRVPAAAGQTYYIEVSRLSSGGDRFELGVDAAQQDSSLGVGDCFSSNGSPGCDDTCGGMSCPGCRVLICAGDSFCCSITWDGVCAGEADGSGSPPGPCVVIPVELQNFSVNG